MKWSGDGLNRSTSVTTLEDVTALNQSAGMPTKSILDVDFRELVQVKSCPEWHVSNVEGNTVPNFSNIE